MCLHLSQTPHPERPPLPKKAEKKRRTKAPVKRRFKMRVIAQPMPTNLTLPMSSILPAEPSPMVNTSTATTPKPVTSSAATSIPVTVYNLAQVNFKGIPNPQEQQPEATPTVTTLQTREDTPWSNTMPASTKLFNAKKSWPIPPTDTPAVVKMEKTEVPPRVAAIPHTLVMNKPQNNRPAEEECIWGPHCPICTKEGTEDQNGDRLETQQRTDHP